MQKVIELRSVDETDPRAVGMRRTTTELVTACVLSLPDVTPPQDSPAPYSAVVETWVESLEDYLAVLDAELRDGLPPPAAAYQVAERVQKDEAERIGEGARTPGVKAIYLVRRRAGLTDAQANRLWRAHAPIAREHHVGMSRYVQNGVICALTEGAPVYHGVAVLHFPTIADLEQRLYSSPEGRAAIQADADRLVEEALPLFCSEFVLKSFL